MTWLECGLAAVVLGLVVGLAWTFLILRRLSFLLMWLAISLERETDRIDKRLEPLEAAIQPKTPDPRSPSRDT